MNYKLFNPSIEGQEDEYVNKSESPLDAAIMIWKKLSKLFKKGTPSFNFSLKDESNDIYDFNVTEEKIHSDGKHQYSFNIKQIGEKHKIDENLIKNLSGGFNRKRYEEDDDDSSSDSSSSDDEFGNESKKNFKLYKKLRKFGASTIFTYAPLLYPSSNQIFIPPFRTSIVPYITINLMKS